MLSLFRGTPDNGDWIVACLEGAWPKLLGDRLAAVCRPVSFKGAELVIQIADRGWEDAVTNLQPELLKKLRDATDGKILSLSIAKP
jgi:hypothetical protein